MRFLLPLLTLGVALAGCSGGSESPEAAPTEAAEENFASPAEEAPAPAPEPLPSAEPVPEVDTNLALPPEEPVAPDEQVLDDADATGMTSRINRDEPQSDAGEPEPVEDK